MDNATVQEPQQNTEQQPEEQVQETQQSAKKQAPSQPIEQEEVKPGRIKRFFGFIRRGPWSLLYPVVFGLVFLGGWWLINHPQFVYDNVIVHPNALYTVLAVLGGVFVFWVVIKFFQAIALWTTTTWKAIMASRKEDPIAWFFWVTIYGLLAVSVLGSGAFFENHFPHPIPGVGYAIALMFDLVTINAMRARLEALRTGDRSISWLYLLAIFICTSATIFGNVYSALDHVNRVPREMKDVSPWLAIIFPSMIIVMSVLADHLLEKTSTRLDAATYRAREEHRLNILIARREMRERMKAEEEKLAKLDAKPKKERRTFFLVRLFFPRDVDMDTLKEQLAEEQKQTSQQQQEAMQKQLDTFFRNAQNAYNNLASLVEKQAQSIASIDAQRDVDNALFVAEFQKFQNTVLEEVRTLLEENSVQESVTPKDANVSLMDDMDEYFSEHQSVQDCDTDGFPVVNTEEDTSLYTDTDPELPTPMNTKRYTQPLPDLHTNEATKPARQGSTKNDTKNTRGEAYKRAMRVLKRNPDIKPAELAEKAKISRTYATQILTKKTA